MNKKLTISINESVYYGLYAVVGARKIGDFIENLIRPHVLPSSLEEAYREMAADTEREKEAFIWSENTLGDVGDVTR